MFYDLIIHPLRIEFVLRVFSPDKDDFTIKKLASKDLDYKFDVSLIENGDHYESFKNIIKELTDPFKSEFNSLNIVLRSSFYQTISIKCDQSKSEFDEYVNWEACQYSTDIPEHYKYGSFFSEADQKMIIVLIRKNVFDYFHGLINELYLNQIDNKLGCIFIQSDKKEFFVAADKQLHKPFIFLNTPENTFSSVSFDSDVPSKKSGIKPFIYIFLFLAAAFAAVYIFNPGIIGLSKDNNLSLNKAIDKPSAEEIEVTETEPEKVNEEISAEKPLVSENNAPVPDKPVEIISESNNEIAELPVEEVKIEEPEQVKITETPVQTVVTEQPEKEIIPEKPVVIKPPEFMNYINSISEFNSDSIIFDQGVISVYLKNEADLLKIQGLDKSKSFEYVLTENLIKINHSSFIFKNFGSESNYNNFIDVKNDHYLFSDNNTYTFKTMKELNSFLSALNKKKVVFKKFIIAKTDEIVNFTVYFD